MIHLDLTSEETEIFRSILESELSDLRYEISNTDSQDFRETLKKKKALLMRVLEMTLPERQRV